MRWLLALAVLGVAFRRVASYGSGAALHRKATPHPQPGHAHAPSLPLPAARKHSLRVPAPWQPWLSILQRGHLVDTHPPHRRRGDVISAKHHLLLLRLLLKLQGLPACLHKQYVNVLPHCTQRAGLLQLAAQCDRVTDVADLRLPATLRRRFAHQRSQQLELPGQHHNRDQRQDAVCMLGLHDCRALQCVVAPARRPLASCPRRRLQPRQLAPPQTPPPRRGSQGSGRPLLQGRAPSRRSWWCPMARGAASPPIACSHSPRLHLRPPPLQPARRPPPPRPPTRRRRLSLPP